MAENLKASARQLIDQGVSVAELMQAAIEAQKDADFEKEAAAAHALSGLVLPPDKWAAFKAHLTDGGGVAEDQDLARQMLQALHDDDQKFFWQHLPHLFKARLKLTGNLQRVGPTAVHMRGAPSKALQSATVESGENA